MMLFIILTPLLILAFLGCPPLTGRVSGEKQKCLCGDFIEIKSMNHPGGWDDWCGECKNCKRTLFIDGPMNFGKHKYRWSEPRKNKNLEERIEYLENSLLLTNKNKPTGKH